MLVFNLRETARSAMAPLCGLPVLRYAVAGFAPKMSSTYAAIGYEKTLSIAMSTRNSAKDANSVRTMPRSANSSRAVNSVTSGVARAILISAQARIGFSIFHLGEDISAKNLRHFVQVTSTIAFGLLDPEIKPD